MSSGSSHPRLVLSSTRSTTPVLLVLLQCFLQALLMDAARPASHEAGGVAPEVGKVQPLEMATMRPGGALVREHQKTDLQAAKSSIMELHRHEHGDPDNDEDDHNNTLEVEQFNDGFDEDTNHTNVGAVNGVDNDEMNGMHMQEHIEQNEVVDDGRLHEAENLQEATELHHTSNGNNSEEVEKKPFLTPPIEHPFKMQEAAVKVGEMDQSVAQMREHVDTVQQAWSKVDGKMTKYDQSIKALSDEFKKLRDSAHGIHTDVVNEFGDREKKRMCSFVNANRQLQDPPLEEIDCSKI